METPPIELNDEQKQMLVWIERAGAVSPGQLAAQTKTLPQDLWKILEELAKLGRVVMREDPDSADGVLVFIAMSQQQTQQVKK
jgi:DNA-binding MarR family transcriptional regulator